MFGISGTELFIIVLFALFVFGPDKLPELGRTAGRFMREFKRAQESMEAVIRAEMYTQEREKSKEEAASTLAARKPSASALDDDDDDEDDEDDVSADAGSSAKARPPLDDDDDDEEDED